MGNIKSENGALVARLTLLILCIVFIFGMLLQFIITEYHTVLHVYVALDILITIPLMYICVQRINKLYAQILLENQDLLTKYQKMVSAFDVINFGVAIMLPDGSLININKKMCRLLGFNQNEVNLKDIEKTLQMDELRNNKKFIESMLEKKLEKYQTIIQCKNRNGDHVWMTANISLVTSKTGVLQYFIIQTQKLFTRGKNLPGGKSGNPADTIAGIMNFQDLEKNVTKAMEMSEDDLTKIVFIYLSADVSEDLSRLLGADGLLTFLQIFSKRLRSTLRDTDYIGHDSKNNFLICMTNVNEFNPEKIIKNINNSLTGPLIINGSEIIISVKYGISTFPYDGGDFQVLRRNAELAFIESKLPGQKNNYFVFNPECLEHA